ncbi:MAG: prepilin-type N-terminal cleavage/methylation domain-containing protein [Campylobacter sp.]|uniref:prepilin-type N-terminal cleavage/methylation domain-containing protein n=1 Tax=Campylobacter sp. TaxID=205 RepID=UPI0036146C52
MSKISNYPKTECYINKKSSKFKKAFTMLELVVVIVVVGILALAALPRLDQDQISSAVDDIMAAVRRTQLLAMQDNTFDPTDPNWNTKRWRIRVSSNSYVISQSQTGREIEGVLDRRYGITFADINCPAINPGDPTPHHIGFDEYGRILEANNIIRGYGNSATRSAFYQSPCVIIVQTRHQRATITVAPVTGAMAVSYQDI